jgi:hypothetical protein
MSSVSTFPTVVLVPMARASPPDLRREPWSDPACRPETRVQRRPLLRYVPRLGVSVNLVGVTSARVLVDGESADRRDSVQPLRALVTIHLSGLPGDAPSEESRRAACFPRLALLRVGFTEPIELPRPLVRSYRTVSPLPVRAREPAIGGLLSVALSCESPRLAVSQHPALWSPDLPQHDPADAVRAAATWPTHRPNQSATHREAFAAHTASVGCRG